MHSDIIVKVDHNTVTPITYVLCFILWFIIWGIEPGSVKKLFRGQGDASGGHC